MCNAIIVKSQKDGVAFKGGSPENWPPCPGPKPTGCSDASDKESTEGTQGSSRRALSLESVGPCICVYACTHTSVRREFTEIFETTTCTRLNFFF